MLIHDSTQRNARHQEKVSRVMHFLAREKYSDFRTLNRLFGFRNHRGLYDLLNGLTAKGWLSKHTLTDHQGTKRALWAVTRDGLAETLPEMTVSAGLFRAAELMPAQLRHHLAVQTARILFEGLGATDWIDGRNRPFPTRQRHRPDGVFTWPNGQRVAMEVVTGFRSLARYREILKKHLLARTDEEWFTVYFVLEDDQRKITMEAILRSIISLRFDGRDFRLEAKHYAVFRCITPAEMEARIKERAAL